MSARVRRVAACCRRRAARPLTPLTWARWPLRPAAPAPGRPAADAWVLSANAAAPKQA